MDTQTGRIYYQEETESLDDEIKGRLIPIDVDLTPRQLNRRKVGRNDPCPCGSGKKFKMCHLSMPPKGGEGK